MAQLISAVYGATTYDAGIPELADAADIRRALADYHYGPGNNAGSSTTTGINYHLGQLNTLKAPLASPTFTGAAVFSGTVSGQTPSASAHLATKNYVDANFTSLLVSTTSASASYVLVIGDAQKLVEIGSSASATLTIPLNSSVPFPIGTQISVLQTGAGQVTVTGAVGVTVNGTPGLKLRTQWSFGTLIKRGTDFWVLIGDTTT